MATVHGQATGIDLTARQGEEIQTSRRPSQPDPSWRRRSVAYSHRRPGPESVKAEASSTTAATCGDEGEKDKTYGEERAATCADDQNRMRQFFGCSLYKGKKEPGCGFGRWVDNAGSYQKAKERFVGNVAVLVDEEMRGQTWRRFII